MSICAHGLQIANKTQQLIRILKADVERGAYSVGDRFASENDLCARHGVSRTTVREAIGALVHEGMLIRRQGKGTFVTLAGPQALSTNTVAIFSHAHGHVFENQTRGLVRHLQRAGARPLMFDVGDMHRGRADPEPMIANALAAGVSGMIMDTDLTALIDRACRLHGLPLLDAVVIGIPPPGSRPRTVYVLSDVEDGTYMGTRHLLSHGHTEILFCVHRNAYCPPETPPSEMMGPYGSIVHGYLRALREAGLEDRQQFLFEDEPSKASAALPELLRGPLIDSNRPTAVFAYGDYRAKCAMDIAYECGLTVPDDLAVIGYWDTPWAQMTRIPLTSISAGEDEMARLAVEALLAGVTEESPKSVVVKPRIVVRESCGK